MSNYTVTDTPSQIVLGGNPTEVSIVNTGPSTVYLDDNTSVSTLNSIALPPTGQMTWNMLTPLFAVCASGATTNLRINQAAGRVDTSRTSVDNTLLNLPTASRTYNSDYIECSAYQSLQLVFDDKSNNAPNSDYWLVFFKYFDANGNPLDTIRMYLPWSGTDANGRIIAQVPVLGPFVRLQVLNAVTISPLPSNIGIVLTASSRSIKTANWAFASAATGLTNLIILPALSLTAESGNNIKNRDLYVNENWGTDGFPDIYLSGIYNTVTVVDRQTGTVSSAGTIGFRSASYPNVAIAASMPIPASGAAVLSQTITIPQLEPVLINTIAPTGGTHRLALVFSNT